MNILAVYGSSHGQTEAVVRRIARILESRGHTVEVHRGNALPRTIAVEDFDVILVGASIIIGRYQRYITEFVRRHLMLLNSRPSAFISVNGTSPADSPAWQAAAKQYVDRFVRETGWHPGRTLTVSGALRYREYAILTRWMMRMINRRMGGPTDASRDYEYTDWTEVARFAEDFGDLLAVEGDNAAVGHGNMGPLSEVSREVPDAR